MAVNVYPVLGNLAAVTALAGTGGTWNGAKVQLSKANITPDPSTLLADMTPADFTGYALSAAVTWGTPFIDTDGVEKTVGVAKQFTQTGTGVTNTVYFYVIVGDPAGTPFAIASFRYTSSVQFTQTNAGLVVLPVLSLSEAVTGLVYSQLNAIHALTFLTSATKYLDGVSIRLFSNNLTPTPENVLADFTESAWTGYAEAGPLVWGVPFLAPDAVIKVAAASVQFTQTGVISTGTSYGWYMVGDPGGAEYLVASQRFDTPVNFVATGIGVVVDPTFALAE